MARRLGVTRGDIVDAAVTVTDRDGLVGLTVAAVAAEVGCRPPSVYHHVAGLDGLVRAVALRAAQQLAGSLSDAGRSETGVEALRSMARVGRAWARTYAGRFEALCQPVDAALDPELAAARRALLLPSRRVLADAGVDAATHDSWIVALVAVVRGTAGLDADAELGDAADRDAAHELLVGLLLDRIAAAAV